MTENLNMYAADSMWKNVPPENLSERHLLILILLDTSGSMYTKQAELNRAVRELLDGLKNDPATRGSAEVCVVGFGGDQPKCLLPFEPLRLAQIQEIHCIGGTPLYAAVDMGLDLLEQRHAELKASGAASYKPFVFILSDGEANDLPTGSFKRIRELQKPTRPGAKYGKIFVYPIGLGDHFENPDNQAALASLSGEREFYTGNYDQLSSFFKFVTTTTSAVLKTVEGSAIELPDPEKFGFERKQISFSELVDD